MADQNPLKVFIAYLEKNKRNSFTEKEWKSLLDRYLANSDDRYQWKNLVDQHNQRALELLERDRLEDAADEWERSLVLFPQDRELRFRLAQVYRSIYENISHQKKHRQKSLAHLERLKIEFSTTKEIKSLEKDLSGLKDLIEPEQKDRSGIFLVFLPLILAIMLVAFTQRDFLWQTLTGWFVEDQPVVTSVTEGAPLYGTREIEPLGFDRDKLEITSLEGSVQQWNGRDAITVQGKILNKAEDIEKMSLSLRILGENKKPLDESPIVLPNAKLSYLMRGESFVLDHFSYLTVPPEDIKSLSLILEDWTIADAPPGNDEDVDISWEVQRPDGIRLRSRVHRIDYTEGYDRLFYQVDLQLENRGRDSIIDLLLELEGYSSDFSPFEQEMLRPVQKLGPPLLPGEKRPFSLLFSINHQELEPLREIHLKVKEIQSSR